MNDIFQTMTLSASGMKAQANRLRHLSENIANADTPGYRRKTVSFDPDRSSDIGAVKVGKVNLDKTELVQVYDPSHPMANADGIYLGSNIDLIVEIADSREAQRSYEANLKVFDQARQMSQSLLELLRR